MKKCILIHINDGKAEELHNGDFMFVERFKKTEEIINKYLSQGYEVKQIIPNYSPSLQGEENFTFYEAGITIYFEKTDFNEPKSNETKDFQFDDFPFDLDSSINEDESINDIIELYLDPTSEFTATDLNELLESMDHSRTTVDMILDAVDSYDIWELYNILFTQYRDLLSDKEYENLLEKYNSIFDIPMPGITD